MRPETEDFAEALTPDFVTPSPKQPSFYCPLTSKASIRLLRIESSSIAPGKSLVFSLDATNLSSAPDYGAISYTWGSPYGNDYDQDEQEAGLLDFSYRITVNDNDFAVTKNMFDALKCFQSKMKYRYVWMDSICINQNDLGERALQVSLMGEIYSCAQEVLVWLGGPHPQLRDFAFATNVFAPAVSLLIETKGLQSTFDRELSNPSLHQDLGFTNPIPLLRRAVQFERQCRWFHRGWVFQEVIMARRFKTICGNIEISWQGFGHTTLLFREDEMEICRYGFSGREDGLF